jgi:predicted nuclease of predicted toxin-antitoxin system
MRFHLDEHVANAVARGLRRHGIDVTTTVEAGLRSAEDSDHLAFAFAQSRVIVTHDDDFLRIVASGNAHAGIVYCNSEKYSVGELLRLLILMHEIYAEDELFGRVEYL